MASSTPAASALCDWWQSLTNRGRRAFLRRQGRPVVMGHGGLYQYFGPAAAASDDDDGGGGGGNG